MQETGGKLSLMGSEWGREMCPGLVIGFKLVLMATILLLVVCHHDDDHHLKHPHLPLGLRGTNSPAAPLMVPVKPSTLSVADLMAS